MELVIATAAEVEAKARAAKYDALGKRRWQVEVGGITLGGGMSIITTRESQAQISSAVSGLAGGLITAPIDWKLSSGWQSLSAVEIQAVASAVSAHVKGCFAAERVVSEQMDAIEGDLADFDVQAAFEAAFAVAT